MDVNSCVVDRNVWPRSKIPDHRLTLFRCSGVSLATISLLGVIQFFNPGYEVQTYQIWLVYCAVAFVTSKSQFLQITTNYSCEIKWLTLSLQLCPYSWLPKRFISQSKQLCMLRWLDLFSHSSFHLQWQSNTSLHRGLHAHILERAVGVMEPPGFWVYPMRCMLLEVLMEVRRN